MSIDWELFLMEVTNNDDIDVYDYCCYKFDCDFETFEQIADFLIDFTQPIQAGLSGEIYKGFVDSENSVLLAKKLHEPKK